ncbi:hypothetical protein BDZ89DRAFT_1139197 [Hymenopellis radicata]|nr:hypothetical protein BDZ89DRAFT_1139197 [Hymenopellis radicata]
MIRDTVISPSASDASRSATRRAILLRFPDSTVKGDLLANLGTLGEDVLFYATMESLFDLPYVHFAQKKGLDSAQFDTALLASPPRKENAIPPGFAQTSPPQTTPRRRTLTLSNVDSHSGSVNTSNARPSPPFPERTPSLTTSITTSGSDDDVCPVTPPIIAGNLDIFDVGVFTPPESTSFRVADSRVIPEKEARLSRDVDDVAIPAVTRSKAAGLPFHLYYADPQRPVMTPMYRTKPKGWSSLFIPPARRVTHRRKDSSITGLDLRFKENPQGEGPRV